MVTTKDPDVLAKAYVLIAATLAPLVIYAALHLSNHWIETHVSIHNDAPVILAVMCLYAGMTIAVIIGVPWMCWRLIAETGATQKQRRAWRAAFVLANVVACLPFLLLTIIRAHSKTLRA